MFVVLKYCSHPQSKNATELRKLFSNAEEEEEDNSGSNNFHFHGFSLSDLPPNPLGSPFSSLCSLFLVSIPLFCPFFLLHLVIIYLPLSATFCALRFYRLLLLIGAILLRRCTDCGSSSVVSSFASAFSESVSAILDLDSSNAVILISFFGALLLRCWISRVGACCGAGDGYGGLTPRAAKRTKGTWRREVVDRLLLLGGFLKVWSEEILAIQLLVNTILNFEPLSLSLSHCFFTLH